MKARETRYQSTLALSQESAESEATLEIKAEMKGCLIQIKGCLLQLVIALLIGCLEAGANVLSHYTRYASDPRVGFSWSTLILTSLVTFMLVFAPSVGIVLFLTIARKARRLRKKGRIVTGTIRKHEDEESDEVEFETLSEPVRTIRVPYNRTWDKAGAEINVIYDPQDPQKNFNVAGPPKGREIVAWCIVLFFAAINLLFLTLVWNV
jgi:hypothetical protein